ncbi:MAG TPA: hypothetical protein VGE40_10405 [Bacilli bacterium]
MGKVTCRNIFIIMAALILLVIASIPANLSTPAAIRFAEQNTDPILWMYTSSETSETAGDLFVKREGADAVRVAAEVLLGSHVAFSNGKKVLYLDDVHRLYLLQSGTAAEFIADHISRFQYGFSADGGKVYYKTAENKLFVKEASTPPVLVAGQVNYYRIAADGNSVYFIDEQQNLYLHSQPDPPRKIASLVTNFSTSDDGRSLIYLDEARTLYLVNSGQSPIALTNGEMKVGQLEISADGAIITYTIHDQEEGVFSDLYVYYNSEKGLRSIKAAEEVTDFHTADQRNYLYYLKRNKQFFEYDITTGNHDMMSGDVAEFKISPNEETILYLTESNDLYVKQGLTKAVRIASGASKPDIVDDHNVIFSKDDIDVYYMRIGHEKTKLSGLKQYAVDTDHLYYMTSYGNLKVIPGDQEEATVWVSNLEDYRRIYTNHHLLYKKLFDLEDLEGDWRFSDGNGYLNFSSITNQRGLLIFQEDEGKRSIPFFIEFVSETRVHLLLLGEEEGSLIISKSGKNLAIQINGQLHHLIKGSKEVN